jgi:hypothetical protein
MKQRALQLLHEGWEISDIDVSGKSIERWASNYEEQGHIAPVPVTCRQQ